jgi:hypothetical protein
VSNAAFLGLFTSSATTRARTIPLLGNEDREDRRASRLTRAVIRQVSAHPRHAAARHPSATIEELRDLERRASIPRASGWLKHCLASVQPVCLALYLLAINTTARAAR